MALWTPAEVTTILWLDAYDASTITVDGSDNVEVWADKSGHGWDATQGTEDDRPAKVANSLDGKPTLRFDVDFLTVSSISFSQPVLVFAVAKTDGGSGSPYDRHYLIDGVNDRNIIALYGTNTTNGNLGIWAGGWLSGNGNDTQWHLIGALFSGPNSVVKRDAQQQASGDPGSSDVSSGLRIGTNYSATADFLLGNVAEMVFTPGDLGGEDQEKIEGYLAHKWGLEGNLPTDHVYKSDPPGMFELSGSVEGETSGSTIAATIRAIRESDGTFVGEHVLDGTGTSYSIISDYDEPHTIIALPPDGSDLPPLIHRGVTPVSS